MAVGDRSQTPMVLTVAAGEGSSAAPSGLRGLHRCPIPVSGELLAPIGGKSLSGSWRGLVEGMTGRWAEVGAVGVVVGVVIPEPVLAGFEASNHVMPGGVSVPCGVSAKGVVAASDMSTGDTAAEVHPPESVLLALEATGSAGRNRAHAGEIVSHSLLLPGRCAAKEGGSAPKPCETDTTTSRCQWNPRI